MRLATVQRAFLKPFLLMLTIMAFVGSTAPARAQQGDATGTVSGISVEGNQRIEVETVRSYVGLSLGDHYTPEILDAAFKRLFATGLFADVRIKADNGQIKVTVVENPIINRVVFEGNKAIKRDDLTEEVKLRPRQVYTRSKVRADVQRIVELYRRKGRFAAVVEPKVVQLEQNRVDLVFEIAEGDKTGIQEINFIGNEKYSDGDLRDVVATKESRWWKIFTSNDTFDPDRLAYDRELLRQFYLTEGYADFRVISAVAEMTPNREDFFITFTLEEGEVYSFGDIDVVSEIRDLDPRFLRAMVQTKSGERYNARLIENSVEGLTNAAGLLGYAFVDIRPQVKRDREKRTINITYRVLEAPRVYVERINIYGNVRTLDRVVRREFRLSEGDAFNTVKLERSKQRIQSLGFFQDEIEIERIQGSSPDKVVLEVNLEERATGQLNIGAGFSSLESFLFDFKISQSNLLGRGQDLRLGLTLSSRRKQINIGFTEPYFLGRNLAAGIDLFRTDYDNTFTFSNSDERNGFRQVSTGTQLRAGTALTEYLSLGLRYSLRQDDLSIPSGLIVSPFVRAAAGKRLTSSVGYSLIYDTLNNRIRPSRGMRASINQDVAGLGGDEHYLRSRAEYDIYFTLWKDWILRFGAEAGHIMGLGEDVRLNNRFFLGGPRIRGFKIRGIGPRDISTGDALGGNMYYIGGAELEFPLGDAAREMGLRSSAFVDVGSLWGLDIDPNIDGNVNNIANVNAPRVTVGVGVSWNSPFGPFRIDLGKAIVKEDYDRTEFLQFNVGTQF